MENGERPGRLELPYGYGGAMPTLNEWAMYRLGRMARSAMRCLPGPHLARVILPVALRHAGESAYLGAYLPDLGLRPTVGRSAPPEGGTGW